MRLSLSGVGVRIGSVPIVADCDLTVEDGERVGLVGPNGSGKTTLLRTVYRALDPFAGRVALSGDDVTTLGQREVARRAALVAQDSTPDFDFTVEEVVAMGRGPWLRTFESTIGRGNGAITAALERVRRATLCVLHDLNLAAAYCDRLYVLHRGRIVAGGPPAEVLTPELVRTVFGVTCTHLTHPATGGLLLAFSPQQVAPVHHP